MGGTDVRSRLDTALVALDQDQLAAVRSQRSTVVLAGPGSGKTATLVLKVVDLLENVVRPPRRVACLTYNNDTVREFSDRLKALGVSQGSRLYIGTVHKFCWSAVLTPFSKALGLPPTSDVVVLAERAADELMDRAIESVGVPGYPSNLRSTVTRIRHAIAIGEPLNDFEPALVEAAKDYESRLLAAREIDFDGMVLRALEMIRTHSLVRQHLTARYPWLAIDEYQDLGGPLHHIVLQLMDSGSLIFAVGDPDQSIYSFSGARPEFLEELSTQPAVDTIKLKFNYRSGRSIIDASEAALAQTRGYEPGPNIEESGRVAVQIVDGGFDDQAKLVARYVLELQQSIPRHEIAILYPRRGALIASVLEALHDVGVDYLFEKDQSFPRSPVVRWLQESARWSLEQTGIRDRGRDAVEAVELQRFGDVWRDYSRMLREAGESPAENRTLPARRRLHDALRADAHPGDPLQTWLQGVVGSLELVHTVGNIPERANDQEALAALLQSGLSDITLADFASGAIVRDRVAVTTYHSSKGRQFDAVILPGLQETLLPYGAWNAAKRHREEPTRRQLLEDRRLFYVALTRARRYVYLVASREGYTNDYGYFVAAPPSRFVREIVERVEGAE